MILLRQLLGDVLRRMRVRQGRTLREVSASARVSLGYLSEVERGRKEASSELLAAICAALETPLSQVFREVSDNFALAELQNEPVLVRRAARARAAHTRRFPRRRPRSTTDWTASTTFPPSWECEWRPYESVTRFGWNFRRPGCLHPGLRAVGEDGDRGGKLA